jgi:hypothetical protein
MRVRMVTEFSPIPAVNTNARTADPVTLN